MYGEGERKEMTTFEFYNADEVAKTLDLLPDKVSVSEGELIDIISADRWERAAKLIKNAWREQELPVISIELDKHLAKAIIKYLKEKK